MALYNYLGERIPEAFANVLDYGAKGDGIADDSSAIQSALTALSSSGGIIYFPQGTYLLKSAVLFYSNQMLLFENGATMLQGAAIDNLLRSYSESTWGGYDGVHDSIISGGVFDGGNYTTANTLIGISHAKNIIFENVKTKNGYSNWHNIEINSSYNVKVINCDFEGSRKTGVNGEMLQIDAANVQAAYPWSNVMYDGTVCKYIDVQGCIFHDSTIVPGIGNHSNQAHEFIRIHNCIFDGLVSSRGAINFGSGTKDVDIHDCAFRGCTTGIASYGSTYYIHDNRFTDATTAISGSTSVAHNNMVNGTFTA